MNNPNKERRQKRFFASDFVKVHKEDMPDNITYEDDNYKPKDGFDIHEALKLNVIEDKETEAKKTKPPKKVRIKKEPVPVPIEPRRLSRIRKPNQFLKGYVETDENNNILKELGKGFVIIGGKIHDLF